MLVKGGRQGADIDERTMVAKIARKKSEIFVLKGH